jgi:hypothetical protein
VPADGGAAWLKALPPMHAHEAPLTATLAAEYPDVVPRVIALDERRRWLLTEETPGGRLVALPDRAVYRARWRELLASFARMQIDFLDRPDELAGERWTAERLAAELEPRLDTIAEALAKHPDVAASGALDAARAAVPRLRALAGELAEIAPGPTLHHGDFHSANILSDGVTTRVVDWAFQAGAAPPFLFLDVVFEEHRGPDVRAEMLGAYLEPWKERFPEARLRRAVAVSSPLAALHAAFGHHVQLAAARHAWEAVPEAQNVVWYLKQAAESARAADL